MGAEKKDRGNGLRIYVNAGPVSRTQESSRNALRPVSGCLDRERSRALNRPEKVLEDAGFPASRPASRRS
jgi:hypothetical protein